MQGITNWIGTIWGTNRGTILVQLERKGEALSGFLRIIEPGMPVTRASIKGTWSQNDTLEASLFAFADDANNTLLEGPTSGKLSASLQLAENALRGTWETDAGTKGEFVAVLGINSQASPSPQIQPSRAIQSVSPPSPPPRSDSPQVAPAQFGPLVTTTLYANAIRLDRDELSNLVKIVGNGLSVPSPVVNAIHKSREYRHLGMDSLLSEPALPGYVESLIVSADEHVIGAGQKIVTVRLMKDGPNTIFVSGLDRTWVEGRAREVEVFLESCSSRTVGFWRKYGNNANGLVFLALLVMLPAIPSLLKRIIVVAVVFVSLNILRLTWTKVVNTRIVLRKEIVPWYIQYADWILTPLAALFAAIVAYLIQRFVPGARP